MYGQYVEPIDYLNIAQCNFMHLLIKPGDIFELTQFQNHIPTTFIPYPCTRDTGNVLKSLKAPFFTG
jgi:hypothetical protein